MQTVQLLVLMSVVGSASLLSSGAIASPTSAAAETPHITVLYDAFGKDAAMTKDWGYAALVEINGKRILFDTGDDPAIFAKNALPFSCSNGDMKLTDAPPATQSTKTSASSARSVAVTEARTEISAGEVTRRGRVSRPLSSRR